MRYPSFMLLALAAAPLSATPLFDDHSTLAVELVGPISTVLKPRSERDEQPFVLRVEGTELDVYVRARGNSRLRICAFPPLRLNFRKGETGQTPFAGQDKLKLVTVCNRSRRAQSDVLDEYVAYRIFNVISDASYRVRLVQLHFTDTDGRLKEKHSRMTGFIIESADELAARLGTLQPSLSGVSTAWLDDDQAAFVYVFQYLIGNTDWSLVSPYKTASCCHNVALLGRRPEILLIPYDFDLAGVVNARYAEPDPSLGIGSVRTRVYRGFCMPRPRLESALHSVVDRKTDIIDVVASLPSLDENDLARTLRYLEAFFVDADDADRLLERFEKACL